MFKGYSVVAFTAAIVVVATTLPVQAGNLPFDTTEIDQYLLIGITEGGKGDAVDVDNGELGAHKAGAPFDEDFTTGGSTFPGQLIGNVPDIPLNALPVFGGIDHSGNIAVTNPTGDFNFNNVGVYANLGVQTADDASDANDSGDNYYYYDTSFTDGENGPIDGAGGFTNTLDSFGLANPGVNNNTEATGKAVLADDVPAQYNMIEGNGLTGDVDFTDLNAEIAAAKAAIPDLEQGDLDGMGNPIHFATIGLNADNGESAGEIGQKLIAEGYSTSGAITASVDGTTKTFTVTLDNPGLTVIDFDVKNGEDILVNTWNFVIDGPPGSSVIFRIPDDSTFLTSNGNILAGTGGIGLNGIIFATLNTVEEQHFDFSNSVLNGVAFWSLTMVNGTIDHNNTQGCAQFIGDIINMNDVRFVHCKDAPPCCGGEIPEPATMTLSLLAVCGIISRRRRLNR